MQQTASSSQVRQVLPLFNLHCGGFIGALVALAAFFGASASGADFTVTTPGGVLAFTINNLQPNPTLTLVRGQTYTFAVNTSTNPNHPFFILSAGVQNNRINLGTVTYTVPNVASNYIYKCPIHGFFGQIVTVAPPPPPPTITILSLSVSTNVLLRSTGTNTWSVNPEYSTNLTATNWFALTVVTNSFLNGVNETLCGRPDGTNLFFRIRSQPN